MLWTSCEKSARGNLICDVLSDAGPHRVKITNLCRLCGKTACSKKTSARPKEKFKLEFERHSVNVEDDDNDLIHPSP